MLCTNHSPLTLPCQRRLRRWLVHRGRGANCSPVRSRVECRDPPASANHRDRDRARTKAMCWMEVTELVKRAQAGDRCRVRRTGDPVRGGRLRGRADSGAELRRGAGVDAGSVRPRHAEAAAVAGSPVLRRLVAADHRPDGDQPADPARSAGRHGAGDARRRRRLGRLARPRRPSGPKSGPHCRRV